MVPIYPSPVTGDGSKHTHTAHCLKDLVEFAETSHTLATIAEDNQWGVFHQLLMAGTPMPDLLTHITHGLHDPEDVDWYLKGYRRWLTRHNVRERAPGRNAHALANKHLDHYRNNNA